MAIYRNVQISFWTDAKVIDNFTPEDKYFYLYLFTNPHTNLCGCYEVSLTQIATETGYSKETVEKLIDRFQKVHQVIDYSDDTKEILLSNWLKYNRNNSPKFTKALEGEVEKIKNPAYRQFIEDFINSGGETEYHVRKDKFNPESEAHIISDFDYLSAWKRTREMYPLNSGKAEGWTQYLDVFIPYPKSQHAHVASMIANAMILYLKEHENDKFYKAINRWFREDFAFYFEKAEEEYRKEQGIEE